MGLIAAGLSNHEIASATGLSINSIKSYIRGAYRKIHVTTRSQAVLWAVRHGCITEPSPYPTVAADAADDERPDLVRATGYPA